MATHSAVVKGVKQIGDVSNTEMLQLMDITDDIRKQIGDNAILAFMQGVEALKWTELDVLQSIQSSTE